MQYLISVIFDEAGLATLDEQAAIDVFNDRLVAEGHWVFAGGLAAPSSATVIDNRGEEAMVTDGPFLESKEYLAGFWIMEAADLDVALALAAEGSKACKRADVIAEIPWSGSSRSMACSWTPGPCRSTCRRWHSGAAISPTSRPSARKAPLPSCRGNGQRSRISYPTATASCSGPHHEGMACC